MRPFSSGLFRRFLLTLMVLALVPAVFMGVQMLRITRQGIQGAVLELHTKLAEKTAEAVSIYIRNMDDKVRFAMASLNRKGLDWGERQDILRSLIERDNDIQEVSVLRNGRELLKVYNPRLVHSEAEGSTLVSYAQSPGYLEFVRMGRERALWVTPSNDAPPRLEVYHKFSEVADIRVSVVLKSLWEEISTERVGGTGFAMLVGAGGIPLIYPPDRVIASDRASLIEWPVVGMALQAQSVGSAEYEDVRPRMNKMMQVGAYAGVPEIAAAVIIQQPKEEAFIAATRMKRTAFLIIAMICVGAIFISMWMARRLTGPLLDLTQGAEKVSSGTFPEPIHLRTGDELQDFAETFNRMMARLKKYAEMQVDRLVLEQQKTEAILFSILDGMLMTDNDGVVQLANRKTLQVLGKQEGDVVGKPLADVLPEGTDLAREILDSVARPAAEELKELDLSTDDHRLFIRISSQKLLSPEKNKELGVVTALHDVTLAKELDKMKEEFLHSITHDLRNPLGSIVGFLEFLKKGAVGELNPQQGSMVESMLKSSNRLMTMVNNILDVAKMQTHELEMNLKEEDVAGLGQHAIEVLGSLAQRRGITMEMKSEGDSKSVCDPNQIERVITNLLGNAIKFAPDDGRIIVHAVRKGDDLEVCVEDNGPGIPASHLDKIFGKFEQVPGQKRGGTGLGLTISKRFVEAHGGRIWVESVVGEGARFYFTLPRGLETRLAGAASGKGEKDA